MSEVIRFQNVLLNVESLPACPRCERQTKIESRHIEQLTHSEGSNYCGETADVVFVCKQTDCNELFVATYFFSPNHLDDEDYDFVRTVPPQPVPEIAMLLSQHDVPSDLRDDLLEAVACWKYGLYQAFGAMARRAIHTICKEKGAYEGSLEQQIRDSQDRNLITAQVSERMHAIRKIGNSGAHPEWEVVTEDMAKEALKALVWVIRESFPNQPPAVPTVPSARRYKLSKKPSEK